MRFLLFTFVVLWILAFLCYGSNGNKNATGELNRANFSDSIRDGSESSETAATISDNADLVDDADPKSEDEVEEGSKFVSSASGITLEHIDFVMLRLDHIAKKTTSNITELRRLQRKEFAVNEVYKAGWKEAAKIFKDIIRQELLDTYSNDSVVTKVPDEYHIALIAYSLEHTVPALYSDFNKKTREVCSGKDVDTFNYKTYFKFLLLAIETLGRQEMRFRSQGRFLYRGVGSLFSLQVGQVLAFQHFVSTSTDLKVAENFTGNTLFEVQGKYTTAISIKDYSVYSDEEEVLFSPFQIYEVESKHEGNHYTRYVLIDHKLPKSGLCSNDNSDKNHHEYINVKSATNIRYLQPEPLDSGALGLITYKNFFVCWTFVEIILLYLF